MNKNPPTFGRIAAMLMFTLSVFALLLFLWVSFGGTLPLRPEGYRFKAEFPEAALLAKEADVRMAGVNVGKVKATELGPGARTTVAEIELDSRFAPLKADARAILRQKSLLGETYVELAPGSGTGPNLDDGGTLRRANVQETVELDEVFQAFDPRTRHYFQEWLHEAGIASTGSFASDLNDSLGNAAPFFRDGADLLRPLDEQEVALRRVVRDTGRVFRAISREDGQLRGLVVNGDATFAALASRDDALAETFEVLPTFLRETRATVGRLERFARDTDPLVRDLRAPADDLAPTLRDLGDLAPDLEHLFREVDPLVDASTTGVPAAERFLEGAEPLLESTHVFMPELNPILAYLSYSRTQVSQFLSTGAGALAGTGEGGYQSRGAGEHYLPQVAIIDSRSLQQRATRPPWERANAYIAPNAYQRAVPLGVIESFDCNPNGGEQRDPAGAGTDAEPPCFVAPAQLFGDEKYPRLRRGHAPVVPAPKGREGNRPARP
ncbi:MAG: phospholipid/cholesterol/gamma-HCH transport system substrate-binding protein [Thermoleophilaceae bacterium]|nr:phospholipid/cholesterol/gamma-HCH transport system substrate-binding protein [Thermoleophilaceae bacterium]